MATQRSILIVDDEFGLAEMLRDMLRELRLRRELWRSTAGWRSTSCRNAGRPRHHRHDDAGDGRRGARDGDARERDVIAHIPIVMMTSLPTACRIRERLFDAVLRKPFTPDFCCDHARLFRRASPMAMAASRSWIGVPAPVEAAKPDPNK